MAKSTSKGHWVSKDDRVKRLRGYLTRISKLAEVGSLEQIKLEVSLALQICDDQEKQDRSA